MAFSTGEKIAYEHYIKSVPLNPDYPDKFNFVLVTSIQHLKEIFTANRSSKCMAYDCETSELNPDTGFIVGYSFSYGNKTSYYVPIGHMDTSACLPKDESMMLIYNELISKNAVFYFNYRFDARFMQYYSNFDIDKIKYHDVAQAVFLSDTNDKFPSLKKSALRFLGYKMITFEEVTEGKFSFYMTDPKESYKYAAGDAICTYELAAVTYKYFKEAGWSGDIDNKTLNPILHVENTPNKIDIPLLEGFGTYCKSKLEKLEAQIYEDFGRVFKIASPKQLSDAFKDMGIYTGTDTATGYMKTGKKQIEPLIPKYPFLSHLIDYKELTKKMNSYVEPLKNQAIERGGYLKFGYKTTGVPCLTEKASVLIKDKGFISIKDAKEGDYVLTRLGWKRILWWKDVGIQDTYKLTLLNGYELQGTGHHPVLCLNSEGEEPIFNRLDSLKISDRVVINEDIFSGDASKSIEIIDTVKCTSSQVKDIIYSGKERVYDIEVEDIHEFIANGIITHNTCRISSGKERKNKFFAEVAITAISKAASENFFCRPVDDGTLWDKERNILMGWEFKRYIHVLSGNEKKGFKLQCSMCNHEWKSKHEDRVCPSCGISEISDKLAETQGQDLNIRSAFIVEDDEVWVTIDFSAQELRIACNLSKEPVWLEAFLAGKDPHKSCYSEDTRILTKEGFKNYWEIGNDTLIAQYIPETGKIEFTKAGPLYINDYEGDMYHFKNSQTDIMVTPNHRMFLKTGKNWRIERADNLKMKSLTFKSSALYDGKDFMGISIPPSKSEIHTYKEGGFIPGDLLFEFMGYFLSEGHASYCKSKGSYRINISQSYNKNPEGCERLLKINESLPDSLKFKVNRSIPNAIILETCHKGFCQWLIAQCGSKSGNLFLPTFIKEASTRQLNIFLKAYIDGDGSIDKRPNRKSGYVVSKSLKLIEDMQYLFFRAGWRSHIDYNFIKRTGVYRISWVRNTTENRVLLTDSMKKIPYKGKVFCYSVPSGLLVCMRNGKSSIQGNTAYAVFGKDNYNKSMRKLAKVMNFGILYGGTASVISKNGGVPYEQAQEFYNLFRQNLPTLFNFIDAITIKAKQTGVVYNYFGRPRRVKYYLAHPDKKWRAFGTRTIINTSIQSAGADIFKTALYRVWEKYGNKSKYKDIVKIKSMIYDELNFSVKKDYVLEVVPGLVECMALKVPGWQIPMEVSVGFGHKWGNCFDFIYNPQDNTWTPKYELDKQFEEDMKEALTDEGVLKEFNELMNDAKFQEIYDEMREVDYYE